jgi:fluoride exporter
VTNAVAQGLGPWPLLLVAAGGALGSVLRYAVSMFAAAHLGAGFPWGTLAVNLIGSGAIGLLGGLGLGGDLRLLLVTGLLGGFTTFSAFSLETGLLWERAPPSAVAYVAASLFLGLAAFAACLWIGRRL